MYVTNTSPLLLFLIIKSQKWAFAERILIVELPTANLYFFAYHFYLSVIKYKRKIKNIEGGDKNMKEQMPSQQELICINVEKVYDTGL